MGEGNPRDGCDRSRRQRRAALDAAAWGLALTWALGRQVALGRAPSAAALLAASGGPPSWLHAPRALVVHGSWAHLVTNLVTILLAAWLWVSLARLDDRDGRVPSPRWGLALMLAAVTGAGGIALATALDGGARVGASGAFHGLVGALIAGLGLRARATGPDGQARRRALALGALMALALPLLVWLGLSLGSGGRGVDHPSHGLGLLLGLILGPLAEHPAGGRALAALAAVWCSVAALA